jgi:SAM-dependent methyltransferase
MDDLGKIGAYYRTILPFYDSSLADRGDLPFWESLPRRWGAQRILELGCGTGRVTRVLSHAATVTAADLLVEMLERARQAAPRAHLVAADLRTFAFTSPFDLIVLADDPMAHLISPEERWAVMQRIADHLTPGGRLVLEGLHRPSRSTPERAVRRDGATPFAVEESWQPLSASVWNATYRFKSESSIIEAESLMRSWTFEEARRFEEAGLHIEHLWGDFDGRPFGDDSDRIIVVASSPH